MGSLLRFNEEASKTSSPKLFMASDQHLKIIWEDRSIDGFLTFLEDIRDFQFNNDVEIKSIYGHIHRSIRDYIGTILKDLFPTKYTDSGRRYHATLIDIEEAAKVFLVTRDLDHFNKTLYNSCKKYKVEQVGVSYLATKQKLYCLRTKFTERYEFMTGGIKLTRGQEDLPMDMVPALNFKEGALLNTWMELTPEGARHSFKNRLIQGTYQDLNAFFAAFFKVVEENYEMSRYAITFKNRISSSPDQRPKYERKDQISERERSYSDRPVRREYQNGDRREYQNRKVLNNVDPWDYTDEALEELLENMSDEAEGDECEDAVNVMVDKNKERRMDRVQRKGEKTPVDQVCRRFLLDGKCEIENCRFSHHWKRMHEEREKFVKLWGRQPAGRVEATNKEKRGGENEERRWKSAPGMKKVKDVRALDVFEGESGSDEDMEEQECNLVASLLATGCGSGVWKASHRLAKVKVEENSDEIVHPVVVLFDSGASGANYVSDGFMERKNLWKHAKGSKAKCRVASGEIMTLAGKILLHITFEGEGGFNSEGWCEFEILRGLKEELILGMPDIIAKFRSLFIEMLKGVDINYIRRLDGEMGEIVEPWKTVGEVAVEEQMIPDIGMELHFLEVPYEEAMEGYLEMLPTRVSEEFKRDERVMRLLEGEGAGIFNPREWRGINMEPANFEFDEEMPKEIKPYRSKVPHGLEEPYEKEMKRLTKYLYEPSNSSVASPVVVAKKATAPFIRIVGDYRRVNKFCRVPKHQIPDVIEELHKLVAFDVYHDLDLTNAYHQVPIAIETARKLSLQTPYGQVQPKFMPEGVSPAAMVLNAVMQEIFRDFMDWMIVIHDNMLVLSRGYEEAYVKLEKVLERCRERNLYLKLSKSRFGIKTVEFFGYVCSGGEYRLSEERVKSVTSIPFPRNTKAMQRFLGASMYFKPFIYKYSEKTALLNEMVRKDFEWAEKSWSKDYEGAFQAFKEDIVHSFTLVHPDYSLDWFLHVDASDLAVGGVLVQKTMEGAQQVVAFVSQKFSKAARAWSTYEKEAYGMCYAVKQLQKYLHGKFFTILTDHRNLVWIETSVIPKIIRIRLFLQTFHFAVLHIPGKENVFADWLSRMEEEPTVESLGMVERVKDGVDDALRKVHNARMGHGGIRRTWLLLNEHFPGHGVSMETVAEFISVCPTCQKYRLGMVDSLPAPVRHLSKDHRNTCGYDLLYVSPPDKEGYKYIHVVKLMPSRVVGLYPAKDLTAESVALALFQFFVTYGVVDVLVTDPGSNINSEVTNLLLQWFGVRLRMSLVNRHQSNGVERTHREVLKFLSMLVGDERIAEVWSKQYVIGVVQLIINSQISGETGVSPLEYLFGSVDAKWLRLPDLNVSKEVSNKFIKELDENIRRVREASFGVLTRMQEKRMKKIENSYKVGDLVLVDMKAMGRKKEKLLPRYFGPYEVLKVEKADVTMRHLVMEDTKVVHMEHIKPYFCDSYEEAYKAALVDYSQHVIDRVLMWLGEAEKRMSMRFLVRFMDGEEVWLPYRGDLCESEQFKNFCRENAPLMPLLHSEKGWREFCLRCDREEISGICLGKECYVDLRAWGSEWFKGLELPHMVEKIYVVECKYLQWENKRKTRVLVSCNLFGQRFIWKNSDVMRFGMVVELSVSMVLVDRGFCEGNPRILRGELFSSGERGR